MHKTQALLFFSLLIISLTNQQQEVKTQVTYLESPLADISWCKFKDKEILLLLNENGQIHRSEDKGFSWAQMSQIFESSATKEINIGQKIGNVQKMLNSPVDDGLILFMGSHGINWYTPDCAQTIVAMNQGRKVTDFQFHPIQREWLLASAWTLCEDFQDKPCELYKELFVSFDLGANWKRIEDYVVQFSWATQDASFLNNMPKERIILAHEPLGKGHQKMSGWSENVEISYSDNFFKSKKTLVKNGNKFLISKDYIFAAQVINEKQQDVQLLVSASNTKKYKFLKSVLPIKKVKQSSFTILDTSEDQIFLHINHQGSNSKYGTIYISDQTGSRYSLSLKNHVRSADGQCDFEKLASLDGIYVANIYDPKKLEMIEKQMSSSSQNSRSSKKKKKVLKINDFKKTLITFDKGGIWQPLTPPINDSEGNNINCGNKDRQQCSLHLHSVGSERFGPFYSSENAVGIMLGTGNVGVHLANRPSEVNTYMSRDGGVNWFEIKKGSHIYEIGNHGGILVMAKDQKATKEILYSWDEGLTWNSKQISKTPIEIENIIIEPTNIATNFLAYGQQGNGTAIKGVVLAIDFASLHQRNCQGDDRPGEEDSDYEYWVPTGGDKSPRCLMGKSVAYVRRKQKSQCWNQNNFEPAIRSENCECSEADWECDTGFSRENDGPCLPTDGSKIDYTAPDTCYDFYTVSQGYRKVTGDSCVGGVDHSPLQLPCPRFSGIFGKKFLVVMGLVIVIGVLMYQSRESLEANFYDIIGKLKNKAQQKASDYKYKSFQALMDDNINEQGGLLPQQSDDLGIAFEENEEPAENLSQEQAASYAYDEKKIAYRGALESAQSQIQRLQGPGDNQMENDFIE